MNRDSEERVQLGTLAEDIQIVSPVDPAIFVCSL